MCFLLPWTSTDQVLLNTKELREPNSSSRRAANKVLLENGLSFPTEQWQKCILIRQNEHWTLKTAWVTCKIRSTSVTLHNWDPSSHCKTFLYKARNTLKFTGSLSPSSSSVLKIMTLTACQQDQLQFSSALSTSAAALLCSHTTKVSPPPPMGNCTFLVLPRLRLSVWVDANSVCKFMAGFPLLWSSSVISQDNLWCQHSTGPSSTSQMSSAEHNLKPIWLLEHPNLGGMLKLLELRGEETLKSSWSSSSKAQTPNHSLCLQSLTGPTSTTPATPLAHGTNHYRSCCLSIAGIPNKLAPVKHSSMGHFRVRKSNWGAMESPAEFTEGR